MSLIKDIVHYCIIPYLDEQTLFIFHLVNIKKSDVNIYHSLNLEYECTEELLDFLYEKFYKKNKRHDRKMYYTALEYNNYKAIDWLLEKEFDTPMNLSRFDNIPDNLLCTVVMRQFRNNEYIEHICVKEITEAYKRGLIKILRIQHR